MTTYPIDSKNIIGNSMTMPIDLIIQMKWTKFFKDTYTKTDTR